MSKEQRSRAGGTGSIGGFLTLPMLVAGGWIAYSRLAIDHNVFLPNAIPGAAVAYFESPTAGRVNVYFDESAPGTPLLLIHSINAAASAFEMGPLFRQYQGTRPVYALDLPGYGFSDRQGMDVTAEIYETVIREFLAEIGRPADVVALSLGCEFAALAALAEPSLVQSLVLISPTGLGKINAGRQTQQAAAKGQSASLYRLFSVPLWARPFFDLLTTRAILQFYLRQSFVGPVAPGFVDYAYATSHQPDAESVPLRFISGLLFTPGVAETVYERLQVPALLLFDEDAYSRFDLLPDLLLTNKLLRSVRIVPTRGLPHFEKLEETASAMDAFWETLPLSAARE